MPALKMYDVRHARSMATDGQTAVVLYILYHCGRIIGHLTVGDFPMTGVPLFLFAFLVSS